MNSELRVVTPPKASNLYVQKLFDEVEALAIQGYAADGTAIYWNRASEIMYGYSAEEALGANLLDLIIPDEMRSAAEKNVKWMIENQRGMPAERLELRHKAGHKIPVYSTHAVVSLPDHPVALFCMDADIGHSARREAEQRVAAAAFESQQSMFITDPHGVILQVNQAFCESTGYSAAEAVGETPRLIRSDYHPAAFYTDLRDALENEGHWQGEIWHRRKNGEVYADWASITSVKDLSGKVTHYVCALTDITGRKQSEARIVELAFYDPLTRLPNRRLLMDRIDEAIAACHRKHAAGALLFIDLDNFKQLNDTLGHSVGDHLLQQLAQRLQSAMRQNDTVARLGGDEFVVMLEDLSPDRAAAAAQAENVARKVVALLAEPYDLGEREYTNSASIGISLFPAQAANRDDLLRQADLAMYEAKAAGPNSLRFFDPAMQAAVITRSALLDGMRQGLREQQFRLYYQTQVDHQGRLLGVEALVRWEHPERGLVAPAEFIPLAEASGLIHPLGKWVLETACEQLVTWSRRPHSAALSIAVNVSAVQFSQADFVSLVLDVLNRTGANPCRLKLELTESLLLHDVEEVIAKMEALKKHGVRFALDDFGTGFSSLSYLQRLPLDQLKIDKSFVHGLLENAHSAAIARTIIGLGDTMGLSVIAEGVETAAQRDLLASIGCSVFQGYLISRPVRIEHLQGLGSPFVPPKTRRH